MQIIMTITLTVFLFLCGLAGFILNRNNVILLLVAIELLLLAVPLKKISFFIDSFFNTSNACFAGFTVFLALNFPLAFAEFLKGCYTPHRHTERSGIVKVKVDLAILLIYSSGVKGSGSKSVALLSLLLFYRVNFKLLVYFRLVIAVLSLFLVLFFLNPVLILTSTRVLSLSLFKF